MGKSPEEMAAAMLANLPEATGRGMPAWLEICKASTLAKHGHLVKLLKTEYGVTHGYANLIAHTHLASAAGDAASGGDLIDAQYAGAKAGLRPVYDAILQAVSKFGKDVEVAPKKAYVSLRRNKQFAIVQPSTRTRVDVGINLKDSPPTDRLELSGSFNSMVSHRVRLAGAEDVDKELIAWLRTAYDGA